MESLKKKNLTIDAGIVTSLGRGSIKDYSTAILELIKNSYDAGASLVDIEIINNHINPHASYIRIADNGCGMTEEDIDNYWLRVGYSEKRNEKFINNRRKTGEKGIGRLSADRLGSILEMRSRTPYDGDKCIIIDWDSFNEMGRNIEEIQFDYFDHNVRIKLPKLKGSDEEPKSGTELIIKNLRQSWIRQDIDDLYKQLSMFISPFDDVSDFNIQLLSNLNEKNEKVIVSKFSNYFEVKLSGTFDPNSKEFIYEIWNRKPGSSKRTKKAKKAMPLGQLITNSEEDSSLLDTSIGLVKVDLLYFPRNEKTIMDSGFKLKELSDYLQENAGIKIYRDSIRVKPYGELDQPGGDWLNLGSRFAQNPAGRSRVSHRIRPSQLVGAVSISRDNNPELSDSASREGLIQDDNFRLLREIVLGSIRLVEATSHEIFTEEEKLSVNNGEEDGVDRNLETVNKRLESVRDDLLAISKTLSINRDPKIMKIGETVAAVVSKITYATESIEVLESQTRLYRGLATIGIASAVFGHETQIQISRIVSAVNMGKDFLLLTPPQLTNAISKMDTAIEASEKVLAWGGFALDRIRRDKRERNKENVSGPIIMIEGELKRAFEAVDITIDDASIDKSIESRIFPIDIETIALNLLTNAYTACKQVKKNRMVKISLCYSTKNKQKGYMISVSDSGPGVNEKLRSIIWEPTFTTKTKKRGASEEGTGMGLAIIDGIVEEMKGIRYVGDDIELGGAKFEIWLPLVQ